MRESDKTSVGILGIGVYLPEQVRRNDWWPKEVVARWPSESSLTKEVESAREEELTSESARRVAAVMAASAADPFRGAVERRVMAADMTSAEMEARAAEDLFSKVAIPRAEIDLLLTHSMVPDSLATNMACSVHERLGLSRECLSLSVEASSNSFHLQLALALEMIRGGYRHALLVQSSAASRVLPYEQAYSAWFGDGATAVLVGPVTAGRGVLGAAHRTDGRHQNTLVAGVPGHHWFEPGRVVLYPSQTPQARRVYLSAPDIAAAVIKRALDNAHVGRDQVEFYACHQSFAWLRAVTQEHAGLLRAESRDTFPSVGTLCAANVPFVLADAAHAGLLRDDMTTVTFAGGGGTTESAFVMRWGT